MERWLDSWFRLQDASLRVTFDMAQAFVDFWVPERVPRREEAERQEQENEVQRLIDNGAQTGIVISPPGGRKHPLRKGEYGFDKARDRSERV
jgi:hypothetical protein